MKDLSSRVDRRPVFVPPRATISSDGKKHHKTTQRETIETTEQQKPTKEQEPEGQSRKDKPPHGMYHRQIEEAADIEKTYQWLEKVGLKDSTEALLMAAHDQALNTWQGSTIPDKTPGKLFTNFYQCTIVLSYGCMMWFSSSTSEEKKVPEWIIKTALKIIGAPLPLLEKIHSWLIKRAKKIVSNYSHPGHPLFSTFPSAGSGSDGHGQKD
ncbi:hypothetical protein D4764_05G0010950 [Takifugu flavidus]|uniref:Uncharacterized protein n=1 Tax=Takifugu flavidus TaxID=433684 RepID=A0A5C6N1N9_9TELE|nr:hypothetical protein D4764_05G0010950 [Takifugu flavidus]